MLVLAQFGAWMTSNWCTWFGATCWLDLVHLIWRFDVPNSGYLPTRTISLIVLQTVGWEIASVIWLQLGDSLGCFQPNFGQVFGANTWLGSILWYRDLYTIWSHGSLHSVIRIAILLDTLTWLWVTLIQFGHTDLECKTRLFGCNFDSLDTFFNVMASGGLYSFIYNSQS